jgi:hypothetical protein
MTVVLGTSFYDADPDTMRRQALAMDGLSALSGVVAVDLQWRDMPPRRPRIRTVPALHRDSTSVTRCAGRAKPIASDVFDALAQIADAEGARYFLFFNSDIVVTADAVRMVETGAHDGYAFARMDRDAFGLDAGVLLTGFDAFAFDTGWWRANRRRFRPYILGEPAWDNVYAAVMMCHADAAIVNRDAVIMHDIHPTGGGTGAFASYNGWLASLDARYFSFWARYHDQLVDARARGATEAEEQAIASRVFVWRRSAAMAMKQAARNVRAYWRYRRERARWPAV